MKLFFYVLVELESHKDFNYLIEGDGFIEDFNDFSL